MCQPTELEFVPTEELIRELFDRRLFVGVLIYSPDPHRSEDQQHRDFKLLATTDDASTILMLQSGLREYEERVKEDGT